MVGNTGYRVGWLQLAEKALLPALLAGALRIAGLNWILGAATVLAASYTVYLYMGVISKEDVKSIVRAVLPGAGP